MTQTKLYQALMSLFTCPADTIRSVYQEIQTIIQGGDNKSSLSLHRAGVASVKRVADACDQMVYDIGMRNTNHPWFFANDMLVHNSCYFSAYPALKNEVDAGEIDWSNESIIDMYNGIARAVSDTFPDFLESKFNVPQSRSKGVIASSRETVSSSGLWITKKRYACLMIDKDGFRLDTGGKPGKVKAMGLDLRRSDTPKFIQEFLSEILLDTLTSKGEVAVIEKIRLFKEKFEDMKPWHQGTPKAVNKLSYYNEQLEEVARKKAKGLEVPTLMVPGHVTASLAWNRLKEINRDQHTMRILDGQKVIVCKLRETPDNTMASVAYPVDETRLPDWFTSLPFDSDGMMAAIVDKKVQNLLGVLKWDLKRANKEHSHMSTLFDFSAL